MLWNEVKRSASKMRNSVIVMSRKWRVVCWVCCCCGSWYRSGHQWRQTVGQRRRSVRTALRQLLTYVDRQSIEKSSIVADRLSKCVWHPLTYKQRHRPRNYATTNRGQKSKLVHVPRSYTESSPMGSASEHQRRRGAFRRPLNFQLLNRITSPWIVRFRQNLISPWVRGGLTMIEIHLSWNPRRGSLNL